MESTTETAAIWSHSKIRICRENSFEYLKENFDSMDFDDCENKLLKEEEKHYGSAYLIYFSTRRYFIILLIGIGTGLIGAFMHIVVEEVSCAKYSYLKLKTEKKFTNIGTNFLLYLVLSLIPALLGSALVIYVQPAAVGGGIAGLFAILNGVNVSKMIKANIIWVKFLSTVCMIVAGLPGGMEAPMVHIGAALGGSLPMFHIPFTNIRPFRQLSKDSERRDLVAAGMAAGLSAAFSAPTATHRLYGAVTTVQFAGGMLVMLEEGLSFWSSELIFRIFICGVVSVITINLILSFNVKHPGEIANTLLLAFGELKYDITTQYEFFEVPVFILMGIIAGLLGSLWNIIQEHLIIFRKKYIVNSIVRILELLLFSTLLATVTFITLYFVKRCSPDGQPNSHCKSYLIKGNCEKDGEYDTMSMFYYDHGESLVNLFLSENQDFIGALPLTIFLVQYFFASVFLMGTWISVGHFIPSILLGSIWGRLLAVSIQTIFPKAKSWAYANKYAFLGAAAQLSGVVRITFSLGVLMIEASGTTGLAIPIFIILITIKWTAGIFTESIFRIDIALKGIPMLERTAPPFCMDISVKDIMSPVPLVTLAPVVSVGRMLEVIIESNYNGFPVVDSKFTSSEGGIKSVGRLLGIILRTQIIIILKNKMFQQLLTPEDYHQALKIFRNTVDLQFNPKKMETDIPLATQVDLTTYMNSNIYSIRMNMSLTRCYKLFAQLGLRHLVVVNEANEVVGIVTRKNLAVFKRDSMLFPASIKKLNVKP